MNSKSHALTARLALPLLACMAASACNHPDARNSRTFDACTIALVEHRGTSPIDEQIRLAQERVRRTDDSVAYLERLGWLYVAKARRTFDDGYYTLAEKTASCIPEGPTGETPESQLLRGHVLHNQHRFDEALSIGRKLVKTRGLPYDYGLLGDALLEVGRVEEAAHNYQKMVDMKPDMRAYGRAAYVRWLKGDLDTAIEFSRMAARAGSQRDPDPLAWVLGRLAAYEFQRGETDAALIACEEALQVRDDYAPALLQKGRILLSLGRDQQAVEALTRAAAINPLPEYSWTLAEALRSSGQDDAALKTESSLKRRGAQEDPRTFSLYLATRGESPERALSLARKELEKRQDIHTYDALAWALRAAGRPDEARAAIDRALREGTQDGRLFLHAAVIARESGDEESARIWLAKARQFEKTLLPSELELLEASTHSSPKRASASL